MNRLSLPLILVILVWGCGGAGESGQPPAVEQEIYILHAGSLSVPFHRIAAAFMEKYPTCSVKLESHGSRTCARQISDLGRPADVMASADSSVIHDLLIPDHAEFCIDFTTNEMAIMYNRKSQASGEINAENWYRILLRPGIHYGHSDPNADPCGYRTMMTWQLAETYYQIPGLYRHLRAKMQAKHIRSKEVDLVALLEVGELDYIFIYRSVAQQHQAPYLVLPDEINLKQKKYNRFYQQAKVKLTGKRPGQWIEKKGGAMVYGMTIPKIAKNPRGGALFIAFVLGSQGQAILEKNGQLPMVPPQVDHPDKLPNLLKDVMSQ